MVRPDEGPPSPSPTSQPQAAKGKAKEPQRRQGYTYLFKYVLVGDCGVGKTSLLKRYTAGTFSETHNYTIGVDFDIKTEPLPSGDDVKLQMWDTAGQERYRTITSSYYRGCHSIVIVYDVTSKESFDNIPHWVQEVNRYCNDDVVCIIVGTKTDVAPDAGDELYGTDKVRQLLEDKGIAHDDSGPSADIAVFGVFQASAKTGEGVSAAFRAITDQLVARKLNERNPLRLGGGLGKKGRASSGHDTIHLGQPGNKPKSRCC